MQNYLICKWLKLIVVTKDLGLASIALTVVSKVKAMDAIDNSAAEKLKTMLSEMKNIKPKV